MAIKVNDIMYSTGGTSLFTGTQPSLNEPGTIVKTFKAGDKIGQAYGLYPTADKSTTFISTDGGYVDMSDSVSNTAPSAPAAPGVKPAAGMAAVGSVLTMKSAVNFRSGPSTTSDILFLMNPGSGVTVTGYGGDGTWYAITDSDGDVGFVKQGTYLSSDDSGFVAPTVASSGDTAKAPASAKTKTTAKKPGSQIITYMLIALGVILVFIGGIKIFGKKKPSKS